MVPKSVFEGQSFSLTSEDEEWKFFLRCRASKTGADTNTSKDYEILHYESRFQNLLELQCQTILFPLL